MNVVTLSRTNRANHHYFELDCAKKKKNFYLSSISFLLTASIIDRRMTKKLFEEFCRWGQSSRRKKKGRKCSFFLNQWKQTYGSIKWNESSVWRSDCHWCNSSNRNASFGHSSCVRASSLELRATFFCLLLLFFLFFFFRWLISYRSIVFGVFTGREKEDKRLFSFLLFDERITVCWQGRERESSRKRVATDEEMNVMLSVFFSFFSFFFFFSSHTERKKYTQIDSAFFFSSRSNRNEANRSDEKKREEKRREEKKMSAKISSPLITFSSAWRIQSADSFKPDWVISVDGG